MFETISNVCSLYFSLNSSICTQDEFNLCFCPLNCRQNDTEILNIFFMSIGQLQVLASLREFTAAIEAKQVAAQDAERAKFVVEKAEQDKRSAIIRAQVLCLSFLVLLVHFTGGLLTELDEF